MAPGLFPRLLLLASVCALREAKSIPEQEVQIRVQVFDSSDLSALGGARVVVHGNQTQPASGGAQVVVHGNQTLLASGGAGADGVVRVGFPYRVGTWVIISASKPDYITNSVPWHSARIPLYASVSLYLLVQRPGTLILYDDVLQLLSGSPGARNQPLVQLQRKSLQLPPRSNYSALSAFLTTARNQNELGGFPALLGQDSNSSDPGWTELVALAVVGLQLSDRNGSPVQVSDPIHVSVPLPSDTRNRMATSVPAWLYQPKTGLWTRSGTGYIRKEGSQFVWSVVVPQMGYWLAAFPSSSGFGLSHPGLRDITTYHTLFLLAILGSLALLVLILLCVLLYYCRRRCLKPRRQQGKPLPPGLGGARRDQGTSTSRLNLICGGHAESGPSGDKSDLSPSSGREDLARHVPAHMLRHAKGRGSNSNSSGGGRGSSGGGESFPMKVTRSTETTNNLDNPLLPESDFQRLHGASDNRGYAADPPSPRFHGYVPSQSDKPPEYSVAAAADGLARPTSLNTQPGQIIFCSSIDQMKENMYRSMVPTLVIPAHYMRLPSDFKDGTDHAENKDGGQPERGGVQQNLQHLLHHHQLQQLAQKQGQNQGQHQQQQQQLGGPQGGSQGCSQGGDGSSDSPGGAVTIPVLFNDSTMAQMNGELQALTEQKLLELGVKQHPRAWFISLDGRANAHVRHSYIDAGNDLSGGGGGGGGGGVLGGVFGNLEPPLESQERKAGLNRRGKDERWGTGGRKGLGGKSYSKLGYQDHGEPGGGENRPASPEENSLTPLLDEGGATVPRRGRGGGGDRPESLTSPEDEDKDENKKSPWQKIEDRPLMVFHPRK
ncbi:LOW QUALITY PROTEIN: protein FAM171A2 [Menidia menidia]